ncbi:MAG: hypothetical protein ABJE47_17870 [bacterium]
MSRALSVGDTAAAASDGELPIVLLKLSRAYLMQSAFERAERPLARQLAITESQGRDRSEVATVLASPPCDR